MVSILGSFSERDAYDDRSPASPPAPLLSSPAPLALSASMPVASARGRPVCRSAGVSVPDSGCCRPLAVSFSRSNVRVSCCSAVGVRAAGRCWGRLGAGDVPVGGQGLQRLLGGLLVQVPGLRHGLQRLGVHGDQPPFALQLLLKGQQRPVVAQVGQRLLGALRQGPGRATKRRSAAMRSTGSEPSRKTLRTLCSRPS